MNGLLIIALGTIGGFLAGIGLAFLFESLDTRLYTVRQVEVLTELPVIGDIPENSRSDGMLVEYKRHAEAFRRLRTNVFSPAQNRDMKTFLVTSAVRRDGRSSVTANLAIITAQARRKVIVVDADLREPIQHEFFGLENERGLESVLCGQVSVDEAIQETRYPGVYLMPSGALPTKPELLESSQMLDLLDELKTKFDVVLLDSPSSVSVTDPAVLAAKVDGVLLVLRHGWVRQEALVSTLRHFKAVGANLLGVVANRTQLGTDSTLSRILRRSENEQLMEVE